MCGRSSGSSTACCSHRPKPITGQRRRPNRPLFQRSACSMTVTQHPPRGDGHAVSHAIRASGVALAAPADQDVTDAADRLARRGSIHACIGCLEPPRPSVLAIAVRSDGRGEAHIDRRPAPDGRHITRTSRRRARWRRRPGTPRRRSRPRGGPSWARAAPRTRSWRAVHLGGDADATGAVAGAIAGAAWGNGLLPLRWTGMLLPGPEIVRAIGRWAEWAKRRWAEGAILL